MASPQAEEGHVDIANELVDKFCQINFSAYEWRVLWAIIRKTYGWHKKTDIISLSQFSSITGLDRRVIHRVIKNLSALGVIAVIPGDDRKPVTYGFQKDYELWNLSAQRVTHHKLSPPTVVSVTPRGDKLSPPGVNTKEKKETIQKKIIPRDVYGEFQNVLLSPGEYEKLCLKWKESFVKEIIEECGNWMQANGKRKKDHYATLLNWGKKKIDQNPRADYALNIRAPKDNPFLKIRQAEIERQQHPELFERSKE